MQMSVPATCMANETEVPVAICARARKRTTPRSTVIGILYDFSMQVLVSNKRQARAGVVRPRQRTVCYLMTLAAYTAPYRALAATAAAAAADDALNALVGTKSTSSEASATSCCLPNWILPRSTRISTCWLSAVVRMILTFERAAPYSAPPDIATARMTVTGALLERGIADGVLTWPKTKTLPTLETITVSPGMRGISVRFAERALVPRSTMIGSSNPLRRMVIS